MLSILEEYNNHLEEIFENSFDYIYLHDKKGNILDVNNVIVKNLGYSKHEILSMKVTDFLLEDIASKVSDEIKKTIETGIVNAPKTYRIKKKDGDYVYIEASAIPLKKEGKFYAILGIGHDITVYREVEKKLKESEEKYYHLFNQSPFNISLFDIKGNLIETNGTILRKLAEYAKLDFTGQNFIEIASHFANSKEIIQLFMKRFKDLREGKTLDPIEFFILTMDGRKIWLHWQSSKVNVNDKVFIQVIIQDITEKKEAEHILLESEEKFRVITEQNFMSIIVLQDGVFKYFNERLPNRIGYSAEEIREWGPYEFTKVIHPDYRDFVLEQARRKQEGEIDTINNYIYRSIRKDGEPRWVENFSKTINYGGRTADLIMSIDITDRLEAEKLIIEENKRLLELHELRKDIITRVSHELKTPLTSIYGANQILLKFYMDDFGEETKKYVEISHRGCLRMKQLIENLLDISRLDSKKFELKIQKDNLVELIIDSVEDMKYLLTDRHLKLKLDLPNETTINIDKLRFRQVLSNIISNAIKNTPKNGEIIISLIEKPESIDIKIEDTGIGFTEKEKEKLFEKFGKIERYGMDLGVDIEGSGLGLYISKEIIELHGGQIYVESEGRNKGSTITIRLYKK